MSSRGRCWALYVALLAVSTGHLVAGWKPAATVRRLVAAAAAAHVTLSQPALASAVDESGSSVSVITARPRLTAKGLLANDVAIRTDALRSILFSFKLYENLLETDDFAAVIRSQMRLEPARSLRLVAKSLCKVLPSTETQSAFDAEFAKVLDVLSQIDALLLKGREGPVDRDLVRSLLSQLYSSYDELLVVVSTGTGAPAPVDPPAAASAGADQSG